MSLVPFRKTTASPVSYGGFDDFDRLFDNLFRNALTNISVPAAPVGGLALRLNVSETDKAYHVEAELPGMEEKDVELTYKEGVLTLSGERRQEEENGNKRFHRVERSYGAFSRSLQLPSDADPDHIDAHMKNGILEIEIAKVKEAKPEERRIAIKRK